MKPRLLFLIILLPLIIMGAIKYIFADRQCILATLKDSTIGEFVVESRTHDLLEGWSICLRWKIEQGLWYQYYMDHESRKKWHNVSLQMDSNILTIFSDNQIRGILNTATEEFYLGKNDQRYMHPTSIEFHDDSLDRQQWIYPDSSNWNLYYKKRD